MGTVEQLKEAKVQEAFNLSEIDDKEFLVGYKHSNHKRDNALSQGVASE